MTDDFFSAGGSSRPWYSNGTWPSAFHDPSTQTTWLASEAWHDGGRHIQVTTYDHAAERYGPIFDVARNPLVGDDHGVPSICMDHQGYVHCFFGAHDSDMRHAVTVGPRDPSAWRDLPAIAGAYAYPGPVLIGSTLFLFLRKRVPDKRWGVYYETTSLADGTATFGPERALVDFGGDSRFYAGTFWVDGTDIHIPAMRADYADTARRHVYHFIFDAARCSVRNADGSIDIPAASLPIRLDIANASFRIVDFGSDRGDHPAFCLDSSGRPHFVYARGSGDPFTLHHTWHDGSRWSDGQAIGPIKGAHHGNFVDSIALLPRADSGVELWYPNHGHRFAFGGDMVRRVFASGVWGDEETILPAGAKALAHPTAVRGGHADARVAFCEIHQKMTDAEAGGLRMYAYGDRGLLRRVTPHSPDPQRA